MTQINVHYGAMKKSTESRDAVRANNIIRIAESAESAVSRMRPADREIRRIFRQNRGFGSHDRRLYGDAVFSLFRWRGWSGSVTEHGPRALLCAMILDAESICPTIQALCQITGVEPATLRPLGTLSLAEKAEALAPSGLAAYPLEPERLIPDWATDKLAFDGCESIDSWIESLQAPLPVWLRAAGERAREAAEYLSSNEIEVFPHQRLDTALMTPKNLSRELLEKAPARLIEIQDIASQCVGIICDAQVGDRWWDVCAGAGGKALQLADIMGANGEILATDINANRLQELKRRLRKSGIRNVKVELIEQTDSYQPLQQFDGVLIDAPCSGSGTWARHPDARWRTSAGYVAKSAERQASLLSSASRSVNPGGKLVYSVCSVLREEGAARIQSFLSETPEFSLDPFPHPLTAEQTSGELMIEPWSQQSIGMYIARLVRKS